MMPRSIPVSKEIGIAALIHERAAVVSVEGGDIVVFPIVAGQEPSPETAKRFNNETSRVWSLEIIGDLLFAGADTGSITVWNLESSEKVKVLEGHTQTVRCLKAYGTDTLISGSRDGNIFVWDISSGTIKQRLTGHVDTVRQVAIHKNKLVSGSQDSTARLWDLNDGKCLATLSGHRGTVFSVGIDEDIVITGCLDTKVRVWNPENGEQTALLHEHGSLVSSILIHKDKFYTSSADGQIIIWKRSPPSLITELFAHEHGIIGLDYTSTADGDYLLSGGADGLVKVCNVRKVFGKDNSNNYEGGFGSGSDFDFSTKGELADAVYAVGFQGKNTVSVVRRNGQTLLEMAPFAD